MAMNDEPQILTPHSRRGVFLDERTGAERREECVAENKTREIENMGGNFK